MDIDKIKKHVDMIANAIKSIEELDPTGRDFYPGRLIGGPSKDC